MATTFTAHQLRRIETAVQYKMAKLDKDCAAYAGYVDVLETLADIRTETAETEADALLAAESA